MAPSPTFKALKVWMDDDLVGHIQLNRPQAANSMNEEMWTELPRVRWSRLVPGWVGIGLRMV